MDTLDGGMNACRLKHVEIFGEPYEQPLSALKYMNQSEQPLTNICHDIKAEIHKVLCHIDRGAVCLFNFR